MFKNLLGLFLLLITVGASPLSSVGVVNLPVLAQAVCNSDGDFYYVEPAPANTMRFAVIGDYGIGTEDAYDVAELVISWNPDFIITVGDNNYPDGEASTIHGNITVPYGDYVRGGRFYPTLGNHDWHTPGAQPYLDYFDLPGNERYYTFTQDNVQFFALDSDRREPDGNSDDSKQARWFQDEITASTATFQMVYMHHAPYSSGQHGSSSTRQWDYEEWGGDVVLAGHDHDYERIIHNGIPYFVNGLGGADIRDFESPIPGSEIQYNCSHGAMLVEVTEDAMTFRFISVESALIDIYTIVAERELTPDF